MSWVLFSVLSACETHQSVETSILAILKLRSAIPPTGTRSLPVAKWSSFFCSSRGNANTTSQKHLVQTHTNTSHMSPRGTGRVLTFTLCSLSPVYVTFKCLSHHRFLVSGMFGRSFQPRVYFICQRETVIFTLDMLLFKEEQRMALRF